MKRSICLILLPLILNPLYASATFAKQTFSGVDDDVITIKPFKEAAIIIGQYTGEDNFIVHPVDSAGRQGMSWFNEIADWSGTVYQAPSSKSWAGFAVKAIGEWTITIAPITSAPLVNPKSFADNGTKVVKFNKTSTGLKKMTAKHSGEGNFIVIPINSKGSRSFSGVNEIGQYSGTTLLPSGTLYLAVIADGDWTISIK